MADPAAVGITNRSGHVIDAVAMWHQSPLPPAPLWGSEGPLVVQGKGLADGQKIVGSAGLVSFAPADFWTCGVKFAGDEWVYILAGYENMPFKEFEVGSGTGINFNINKYLGRSVFQSEVTIDYDGDNDDGSAVLVNWLEQSTNPAYFKFVTSLADYISSLASK